MNGINDILGIKSLSNSSKCSSAASSTTSSTSSLIISSSKKSSTQSLNKNDYTNFSKSSPSSSSIKYSNDLNCPLCKKRLQEPKLLNCLHIYCKNCLIAHYLTENSKFGIQNQHQQQSQLTCPKCKKTTQISDQYDIVHLQDDHVLSNMLDMAMIEEQKLDCTSCKSEEKAVARCTDCAKFLCSNCVSAHENMTFFSDHFVVRFQNDDSKIDCAIQRNRCDLLFKEDETKEDDEVDAQRTPFGPVSLPRISKVQKKKQEGKENDDDSKNSIDFSKRKSDNQISGNGSTDDLLSTNDNINSTDYSLVHNNEASISNVSTIMSDQSINAHQLPDYVNEINRLRMELLLLPCKQLDVTPLKYQCTVDNCNDIPRRYDYMRYHQIIDHLIYDFDIMFHMVTVSNTDGKQFQKPKCKICNMVFTNKGPAKTHMVSSHIILHEDYENIGTENTAQNQSNTD